MDQRLAAAVEAENHFDCTRKHLARSYTSDLDEVGSHSRSVLQPGAHFITIRCQ